MAHSYRDRPSSLRTSLTDLAWRLVTLAALVGCTALGWYLFVLAREARFDNAVAGFFRSVAVTLDVAFRLDPVLTLIVGPFAVLVILILMGLLIWMHKDRR